MGKKRIGRGGSPLEWVAVTANVVAGAAQTFREAIDLNLDDDEVAEIWKIDSNIRFADPSRRNDLRANGPGHGPEFSCWSWWKPA